MKKLLSIISVTYIVIMSYVYWDISRLHIMTLSLSYINPESDDSDRPFLSKYVYVNTEYYYWLMTKKDFSNKLITNEYLSIGLLLYAGFISTDSDKSIETKKRTIRVSELFLENGINLNAITSSVGCMYLNDIVALVGLKKYEAEYEEYEVINVLIKLGALKVSTGNPSSKKEYCQKSAKALIKIYKLQPELDKVNVKEYFEPF